MTQTLAGPAPPRHRLSDRLWPLYPVRPPAMRASAGRKGTGPAVAVLMMGTHAAPKQEPAQHPGPPRPRPAQTQARPDQDGTRSDRCSTRMSSTSLDPTCRSWAAPVLIQALDRFRRRGQRDPLSREHLLRTRSPGRRDVRSRPAARLPVPPPADDLRRGPLGELRGAQPRPAPAARPAGTEFLLLAGPEPDLQWERFIAAVTGLIDRLGVRLTVGLNAIPMAVPHTRPVRRHRARHRPATCSATTSRGCSGCRCRPASATCSSSGSARPATTPWDTPPRAALPGADQLPGRRRTAARLGLRDAPGWPCPPGLREAADLVRAEVDKQVADDEQAAGGRLAGAAVRRVPARPQGNLLADATGPLPTAEELGAELERFLADQSRPGDPPQNG